MALLCCAHPEALKIYGRESVASDLSRRTTKALQPPAVRKADSQQPIMSRRRGQLQLELSALCSDKRNIYMKCSPVASTLGSFICSILFPFTKSPMSLVGIVFPIYVRSTRCLNDLQLRSTCGGFTAASLAILLFDLPLRGEQTGIP